MRQTYLMNDRIYLRAVEPEDIDVMYQLENDPSMWDISNFTVPYSRYVLRQYIQDSQCDVFADKQLRLMIIDKADEQVLGTIDITDFVPLHLRGEVGIAVRKDYRQRGYASDALKLVCEYAFDFLSFHQLYAHIATDNDACMRLFLSCGFTQCGVIKDWLQAETGYKDVVLLQCLNPKK
ncbi:GNAT family N-acetyltransferase [Bacteroides reticulotermitis]|uniref:Spermidine N1-acetyltransferase n=2 Tax=Bacteroides reticulotermitis TaxID=1133319 RepID=W4V0H4_9BACE|nr:GNAT family N-acetyltransferase [Bacteroides reticulotermitis]MBB4044869.1 diamine N-acetyltransferase [Bacteroides reticulotermitis]GAE86313.1 spermidine N1-acetyltransferase [Bacteroides reticulotermitis JCM 10512]